MREEISCKSPDETFEVGQRLGSTLLGGEVILLYGGLGAGKTLLTKGIMGGLKFDVDEVTSPSFTLVNLYKTASFNVYHIDLWRLDAGPQVASAVGLGEIFEDENAIVIIEWADRLGDMIFDRMRITVQITGDGDEPRQLSISGCNIDDQKI